MLSKIVDSFWAIITIAIMLPVIIIVCLVIGTFLLYFITFAIILIAIACAYVFYGYFFIATKEQKAAFWDELNKNGKATLHGITVTKKKD